MRTTLRLLYEMLDPAERARFARISVAVFFSNLLETLSVGALLPFMVVVSDPESAFEGLMGSLHQAVGAPERSGFLLVLGGALLILVVSANLVAAIVAWSLSRFGRHMQHNLSERMLLRYVRQPYAFFLGRNSAELSKNVLSEVEQVTTGVVIPVLYGLARGGFVLMVTIMLFLVDIGVAISATVLVGGGYTIVYALLRGKVKQYGEERIVANSGRFQAASEVLSGIKAVKILGREKTFVGRFSGPSKLSAVVTANNDFLTAAPRHALESIAFGGMILLVMLILVRPGGPEGVLPLLALFGFAGVKLMPAVQQVYATLSNMRFNALALAHIHEALTQETGPDVDAQAVLPDPVDGAPLVAMEGVTFKYPGSDAIAVDGVSLDIRRGHVHGFVGQTGSGKTTTMDLFLGLLEPTAGRVMVDGNPLEAHAGGVWRRRVGYVPQEIYLTDDSVANNIAFGIARDEIDMERVRRVAKLAIVDEVVEALPQGYQTLVGERGVRLSGGQRQRLGIARALYLDPELMIFDEGTSALDPSTEATLLENLEKMGATVVWVTHRLATVRRFGTIFVFHGGRLVGSGSHRQLMEDCPEYQTQAVEIPDDA